MHAAWWETLTHLRDTAPPGAIVHTWWDYGHWVTYGAERPVSGDGTSLLTYIPHWLGKALVAPDESESVGVLRMLTCGADATPLPEGKHGAYGTLRAAGRDPATAYTIVADLVSLDRPTAEAYLTAHGFTAAERGNILRATHCAPPAAYLILSDGLRVTRRAWMGLGLWDPHRGQPLAAADTAAALGPVWLPCRAADASADPIRASTDMVCEIPAGLMQAAGGAQAFVYNPTAPQEARLHLQPRQEQAGEAPIEGTPAVVLLAGAEQMQEVPFAAPTHPALGVLVDVPNQRMLVGPSPFVQSTFVHLLYLEGRYATHYEKVDDRTALEERVVTWRINWHGQ